jgi:transposase
MGKPVTRTHLVGAATVIPSNTRSFSTLKDWGLKLSKRIGFNKAKVALARKLAIIMFSLWRDGTHFMAKAADVPAHRQLMQSRMPA